MRMTEKSKLCTGAFCGIKQPLKTVFNTKLMAVCIKNGGICNALKLI